MSQHNLSAKLGLYVHWPYCARICPYCDFNVRRDRGQDTEFLVDAIIQDIKGWRQKMGQAPALTSLSFGGGTPSLLHPKQMQKIIQAAEQVFGFQPGIEISLEANPTDYEASRYRQFADIGVNRLSLGVQSLKGSELEFLGRDHSVKEAFSALKQAGNCFSSVSADFIYGLPQQSLRQWSDQLQEIMKLGLDHLSLYCLSIEPRTAFFKNVQRGLLLPTDDDQVADMYELTQTITTDSGLQVYETSNHSFGSKNRSLHNLLYWQGDDWIGVGPGAHGRVNIAGRRHELSTHRRPQDYAKAVGQISWGVEVCNKLSSQNDLAERLLLGLRLSEGIDVVQMQNRAGCELDQLKLEELIGSGLLQIKKGKLKAKVPLLVDRIASQLLL